MRNRTKYNYEQDNGSFFMAILIGVALGVFIAWGVVEVALNSKTVVDMRPVDYNMECK